MCEIALEGYAVGIGELVDYAKQRKQELARVGWRLELLSPLTVVVVALGGAAILNRIMSSIFSMAISLIVGVIVSALFWMVLSIRLERFRQPPF
jgi:hypothetical protein